MIRLVSASVCALLIGCSALLPDAVYVEAGYSQSDFDRPVNQFDTSAVLVGAMWNGDQERHRETMSATRRLDDKLRELVSLTSHRAHPPAQPSTVVVSPAPSPIYGPPPPPVTAEIVQPDDGAALPVELTRVPETMEDAWIFLIWTVALLVVATGIVLLKRAGVRLPFLNTRRTDSDDE